MLVAASVALILWGWEPSGLHLRHDGGSSSTTLADQVLNASDAVRVSRAARGRRQPHGRALGVARPSRDRSTEDMPHRPPGKVYQLWLQQPATGHGLGRADARRRRPDRRCSTGDAATATAAGDLRRARRAAPTQPTSDADRALRLQARLGMADMTRPRRIAVVGSGVAGLTAAYVASRRPRTSRSTRPTTASAATPTPTTCDGRWRARHRHRLHRPQRAHLPDPAAALRRARASPPSRRRCRCRSATTRTGLEYAGALGPRGLFPSAAQPRRPGVPADAHRDPSLPPAGPRACSSSRTVPTAGPDPARLPRRGRLHAVLLPPLHGAPRRRRLVVRPGRRARLPGALPLRRSSTTTACSASSAPRSGGP